MLAGAALLPLVLLALISSYTRTGWVGFVFGVRVLAFVRYRSILVVARWRWCCSRPRCPALAGPKPIMCKPGGLLVEDD